MSMVQGNTVYVISARGEYGIPRRIVDGTVYSDKDTAEQMAAAYNKVKGHMKCQYDQSAEADKDIFYVEGVEYIVVDSRG